nr:hypothetical protein CFP56_08442 [Quercus suber]
MAQVIKQRFVIPWLQQSKALSFQRLPITHAVEQHPNEVRFSRFEDMKANVHKAFDEELLLQHMTTLIAKN